MRDEILTVDEVAEFLKVNRMTVYRKIRSGQIEAFKLGRHWRVRREDLDNFIDQLSQRGIRTRKLQD